MSRGLMIVFVLGLVFMEGIRGFAFVQSGSDYNKPTESGVNRVKTEEDQQHPDLALERAEVPRYPPIARVAHVQGTIRAQVTVRKGVVTQVNVTSGPGDLAKDTVENINTWRFHPWVNTTFETQFVYRLDPKEKLLCDPRIVLQLPLLVEITTVPPSGD